MHSVSTVCVCVSCRFSSVQLLGDLLFHISGVTGKMTTETASEDDNFGTAASNKVITQKSLMLFGLRCWHGRRLTSVLFPRRPSLELLAPSGVTASCPASTWAALTPSWWSDRLPSTCGRLWCPTRRGLSARSSPHSSHSCWASWPPPVPTRERY